MIQFVHSQLSSSTVLLICRRGDDDGETALDRYFRITERGSTVRREIRGGLVTFFTMAYIVVLNPLIIGTVADADGGTGGGVLGIPRWPRVTALVAGVMTIAMGVIGRLSVRAGHRPRPQRLRRVRGGDPDVLGRTRWAWWCSRAW